MEPRKFGKASFAGFLSASALFGCMGAGELLRAEFLGNNSAAAEQASASASAAAPLLSTRAFTRPSSLLEVDPDADTLRTHASRIGLYFGTMVDSMQGNGWETVWVRNTTRSEFNLMMPGNQFKWHVIQPTQDTFEFGPAESFVEFAIAHNMKVRGHTLVWGMANPEWLGNEPASTYTKFTGEELEEILVRHVRTVMGHYRDKYPGVIKWWDVTNEVMGWDHEFNSDGILWTKIGTNPDRADYVRVAFRTAREADPNAILCMNDWGNDGSIPKRTMNMIEAVRALKAEKVPIDCVGMQAHLAAKSAPSYNEVLEAMQAYAEMGVQVQVTEFDIQVRPSARAWSRASRIATDILKACVDSPNCTAFNNWGFSQAFYLGSAGNPNTATMLPWDVNNKKSPQYAAMRTALKHGSF